MEGDSRADLPAAWHGHLGPTASADAPHCGGGAVRQEGLGLAGQDRSHPEAVSGEEAAGYDRVDASVNTMQSTDLDSVIDRIASKPQL